MLCCSEKAPGLTPRMPWVHGSLNGYKSLQESYLSCTLSRAPGQKQGVPEMKVQSGSRRAAEFTLGKGYAQAWQEIGDLLRDRMKAGAMIAVDP